MDTLLRLEDLTMHYKTKAGWVQAIDGVSFSLDKGQSLGLVGGNPVVARLQSLCP